MSFKPLTLFLLAMLLITGLAAVDSSSAAAAAETEWVRTDERLPASTTIDDPSTGWPTVIHSTYREGTIELKLADWDTESNMAQWIVIKRDSDGKEEWTTPLSPRASVPDYGMDIWQNIDGTYTAVVYWLDTYDRVYARLNPNGELLWETPVSLVLFSSPRSFESVRGDHITWGSIEACCTRQPISALSSLDRDGEYFYKEYLGEPVAFSGTAADEAVIVLRDSEYVFNGSEYINITTSYLIRGGSSGEQWYHSSTSFIADSAAATPDGGAYAFSNSVTGATYIKLDDRGQQTGQGTFDYQVKSANLLPDDTLLMIAAEAGTEAAYLLHVDPDTLNVIWRESIGPSTSSAFVRNDGGYWLTSSEGTFRYVRRPVD